MTVLGLKVGRDVEPKDVFIDIFEKLTDRISHLSGTCMSMAMRVIACNVFLSPLFSYVGRVLLMPDLTRQAIDKCLRDFALRVPVVRFGFLAYLSHVFGISTCL